MAEHMVLGELPETISSDTVHYDNIKSIGASQGHLKGHLNQAFVKEPEGWRYRERKTSETIYTGRCSTYIT